MCFATLERFEIDVVVLHEGINVIDHIQNVVFIRRNI